VLSNKTIRCWGVDSYGELGNGGAGVTLLGMPSQVEGVSNGVEVSVGYYFSCARLSTGGLSCWGGVGYGELGNDTSIPAQQTPVAAGDISAATGVGKSAGIGSTMCALQDDGTAWCWGYGAYGNIGDGATATRLYPSQVAEFEGSPSFDGGVTPSPAFKEIAAGTDTTCVIRNGDEVWCWGGDNAAQPKGIAPVADTSVPTQVDGVSAIELAAGETHVCALQSNGDVKCWGGNDYGQLGTGDVDAVSDITTVTGIGTATRIAAGNNHTCALLANGSVKCWGANTNGQLGIGGQTNTGTPTTVRALQGVSAIGAGADTSCAALGAGGLRCWGKNGSGQVGDA
jgi:alpha-tubulin suppressor-like RCC1 family protein